MSAARESQEGLLEGSLSVAAAPIAAGDIPKAFPVDRRRRRALMRRILPFVFVAGDALALTLALFFGRISHAYYYQEDPWHVFWHWWTANATVSYVTFPVIGILTLLALANEGHYTRRRAFWDEMGGILKVLTAMAAGSAAWAFVSKWPFSRLWLVSLWTLALFLVPIVRHLLRATLSRAGLWHRSVVVIGTGSNARDTIRALRAEKSLGYVVRAVLSIPGQPPTAHLPEHLPVSCLSRGMASILQEYGDPEVVVALEMHQWEAQADLINVLEKDCGSITISPPLRGLPLFGLEPLHFFSHEILMLQTRDNLGRTGPRFLKRAFDLVLAPILALVLSPLLAVIAWRISAEDGGSILFRHKRVGRDGRAFFCLKFRTMAVDAEQRLAAFLATDLHLRAEFVRTHKLRKDPRITRIGAFLRRTSLDELPQLFNVIRGDMSLVGPRPIVDGEVASYGPAICLYRRARPGITGLWQTQGRSETTFEDRTAMDAWYIRNWSLWHDTVILFKTVSVVLKGRGAY